MDQMMFFFFAACAVVGGVLVALLPKLVHSAFALVLALFGVAGLYWTLGADFLGIVQLLVYVGGITILFLFGVMMTPKDSTRWTPGSLLLPGLLCVVPLGVLLSLTWTGLAETVAFTDNPPEAVASTERIGELFIDREGMLIPFELASVVLLVALVGAVYLARRRKEA